MMLNYVKLDEFNKSKLPALVVFWCYNENTTLRVKNWSVNRYKSSKVVRNHFYKITIKDL